MYFDNQKLLTPPVARAAYSDRMAWLLAEMSRLAYVKFEHAELDFDYFVKGLTQLRDENQVADALEQFKDYIQNPAGEKKQELVDSLSRARFELVRTFCYRGTEAFLAKRDEDRMAVLAFRGTEKNFEDIRTDINARFFRDESGTRIHTGFLKAFECVEPQVRKALEDLADYKLYVTGHSLGGALALVATRSLNSDNLAACYTFGSPRVGSSEFGDTIKPPIYRVVNAADVVPRLPPQYLVPVLMFVARIIPMEGARRIVLNFLRTRLGYVHHGDMRYLTACKADFSDLRLIPNLDLVSRAVRFVQRILADKRTPFTDHRIAAYCGKLEMWAEKRAGRS